MPTPILKGERGGFTAGSLRGIPKNSPSFFRPGLLGRDLIARLNCSSKLFLGGSVQFFAHGAKKASLYARCFLPLCPPCFSVASTNFQVKTGIPNPHVAILLTDLPIVNWVVNPFFLIYRHLCCSTYSDQIFFFFSPPPLFSCASSIHLFIPWSFRLQVSHTSFLLLHPTKLAIIPSFSNSFYPFFSLIITLFFWPLLCSIPSVYNTVVASYYLR